MGIFNEHSSPSNSAANTGTVGRPGIGFKLTDTGDYDMQNKKLTNVKSGTDSNDAANKSQLDSSTILLQGSRAGDVVNDKAVIYSNTGAVHARSLYLLDDPQDGNRNEVRLETPHQSYGNIHLNIPDLHNFDGYGGRPKSEVMVTSVEQTVTGKKVFENIEVHDPTSNNQATNKLYVDHNFLNRITGGQIGGDLDMRGNTIKYLKLDNTESAAARVAELNLKLNRSGDKMDGDLILQPQPYPIQGNTHKAISYNTTRSIFLSRKESFPMDVDINMNNNLIQNVATPTSSHQATNKGYCDYNFLNRQKGGVLMGPLSMNRNDLTGIPDTPKFGFSAVNKNYVDGEIAKIPQSGGNVDTSSFVKLDGSRAMTGNLNMYNHKIENLNTPTNFTDAATKQYIDETLLKSHLISSEVENAFKYLSDQDESSSERNIVVHGIQDFANSPHKKNKKAYNADLIYTIGLQYYDSKIGINLYSLPIGKYTVIMEYYFSEDINIKIYIEATHALINDHQLTNFPNYKKILVQINRQSKIPDYLFFTITGNGTTSTNPEVYLIFYGIKGWVNNIPQEIYDHALETGMFEYDNGNMKMSHDIDMDNNKIINLDGGIDNNDAVNMEQFNSIKTRFDAQAPYMKNNIYMTIFTYRFFDFHAISKYKFSKQQRYHAIIGIEPDLSFSSTNGSHLTKDELIYKKGLQFNNSMHIIIDLGYLVDHNMPYTMMMSLTLKDNLQIYFVEPTHEQYSYFPIYQIQKSSSQLMSSQLIIKAAGNVITKTIYSSRYNDQQCLLWIEYSPQTNTHTISLPGFTNVHHIPIPAPFSTRKLRIDPGNNIIKKFGYQNQLINSYDDYFKISLEEKNNGTII